MRFSLRLRALALALIGCGLTARSQDPNAAYPRNYSIALETDEVTVMRVHYAPHEKLGVHDHSKNPTVYVYLNDAGPVQFQHFEEHAFALTRPPTNKGAFRSSPGRLEAHTVENLGDQSSDFLRVELKQVPLNKFTQSFRGAAPRSLSHSGTTVEFKNPFVEVQRIICAAPACPAEKAGNPSVLVAFTSARFTLQGKQEKQLEPGTTLSLSRSDAFTIAPLGDSVAHLLRIVVPRAGK